MDEQLATPLSLVVNRIATGVTCIAILISIFFTIWALTQHGSGPIIGVIVFQLIALGASVFLSVKLIFEKCKTKPNDNDVDFI